MKKIGEGAFREIYILETNPDLCIKRLKKTRKKIYFGIKVNYKLKVYTLLKYGIKDFNKYEFEILEKVKEIIPNNIPSYYKLTNDGLIQTIVKDYNGKVSKNITKYNGSIGEDFLIELEKLIKKLMKNGIDPMDILHNVIIQEYEKGKFKPILFDFKRTGGKTYPFQPWLIFSKKARENKIYRRLERIKKQKSQENN